MREISSCSSLTVRPGSAWVLLIKTYIPLFTPLYRPCGSNVFQKSHVELSRRKLPRGKERKGKGRKHRRSAEVGIGASDMPSFLCRPHENALNDAAASSSPGPVNHFPNPPRQLGKLLNNYSSRKPQTIRGWSPASAMNFPPGCAMP